MLGNHTAQMFFVDGQFFNIDKLNQLRVNTLTEIAVLIEHISETTGHTCTEVHACFADDADNTASHVFTTVIANAFNHGNGSGVTHGETLTRAASSIKFAAGCTVQTGVTDDGRFMATEGRANRRTQGNQTACHTFANIVVSIASQMQFNTTCVPHTEALPGGAAEMRFNRIGCQTLIAIMRRDIT
ncbi:hypothetical protein D3C75_800750 [compost metagenome]